MLDICLLGTGGMMPLPNRWLTSLMMRYNGTSILIDCGEGTQIAIKEKGWSFHPIDIICFTHYHGDHISGLPGLLLSMGNADRTEPVIMIGPKGLERVVNSLRVIAPELPFPIQFIELKGAEETFEINGYIIEAFRVNHNVTCYGYNIKINRAGRFYVERAMENQVPKECWSRLQKGEVIDYIVTEEDVNIEIQSQTILSVSRKELDDNANLLLQEIVAHSGSFELEEVAKFVNGIRVTKIKTPSSL